MSYLPSGAPDVTETIPAALSARLVANQPALRKINFDVTVNGLGFCIDPDGSPYTLTGSYIRQTMPVQKDQQDNSKEPGEQTLDGYWIRSQNSWHRGAGIVFYEPGAEPDTEYRFTESSGVNVWTKGQLTGLPKMTLAQAAPSTCFVEDAGNGHLVYLDGSSILGWGTAGSYTLNTPPAGYNGRYYFLGYQKYVKVGWVSPADATIGIWNGGTDTVIAKNATVEPKVWYLKDRLVVAHGKDLFEVPLNTASATPVDLAVTGTNLYSPTDANTTWLDMAEGPNAIYAAWGDGTHSGIVRFSLQDASSGQSPKLSQAYQVLSLPVGEQVHQMYGYLGRYLVLATSRGIRVCAIDSNGDLVLGQVLFETTDTFTSFAGWGNFVYVGGASVPKAGTVGTGNLAGWGTATGVVRINLGEPVGDPNNLVFAWANDLRTDVTGTMSTLAFNADGTLEVAVNGSGVWRESADPEVGGYLAMGRIRYGTVVPKVYRSLDMSGLMGADSTFTIKMYDERERPYYSLTMDASTGIFPSLLLDLTKTFLSARPVGFFTTVTSGLDLQMIQLRALPSPPRVRQIRYPLACMDIEQDGNGNAFGYPGYAFDRITALEKMEENGHAVNVVDNRTGESFAATIEEIQYHGVVAPDRGQRNYGGHATVTFKKLT